MSTEKFKQSAAKLDDILIHISGYAGFPVALNDIATAREIFNDIDKHNTK